MDAVKRFEKNVVGRDFVVGDIHGCFSQLEATLAQIQFDPKRDRLFSVGDLVDRGKESQRALEFLNRPWFHAVRGNHDQMAIDEARHGNDPYWYAANGGSWFIGLTREEKRTFADAFEALPLAIEVETERGLVGVVHADCPFHDWASFRAAIEDEHNLDAVSNLCMWDRDRITNRRMHGVPDLLALIVGHTPVQQPVWLGNVFYIDTGAVFGRDLTVADLSAF